ncbi:MAG: hypothetical protein DI576_02575 [Actinomyces sp.]|nr:MAG: hypothetical protein DI576_02575 [Actinomyces sp.]
MCTSLLGRRIAEPHSTDVGATSAPPRRSRPSARTDLGAELNRSRRGTEPISTRNSTDLDAELDRSRRGTEPISAKKKRGPAQRLCASSAPVHLGAQRPDKG